MKTSVNFASLSHCVNWATSDPLSYWNPDNTFNDRNNIPSSLSSRINNVDNYVRLFSSSTSYIRWDYLWNFFKTIRHQNRFGPSFSTFNSFTLKCSNNILPTGDNLTKRHDQIYDNWNCVFCNRNLETLHHLLNCPALTQQWKTITDSALNFLCSLTTKLCICNTLPDDSNDLFPIITDFPDDDFTPPIQALAIGVFPAYLELDLYKWNIRSYLKIISTVLIKHIMSEF